MEEGAEIWGFLSLPLLVWNHDFMSQGKGDHGLSGTSIPQWRLGIKKEPLLLNSTNLGPSLSNLKQDENL